MTGWVALGLAPEGVRACAMKGGRLLEQVAAGSESAALEALSEPADRILRIGDGTPAGLPAPILPASGPGLPGFSQKTPADVIGGWVRLWLAGFLASQPDWDGVINVTEGPVSHWVHISAGEAVSSQSFLTPRLVDALGGAETPDADAIADSLSRPERLAAHLRAAEVSGNLQALTGHLIGAELAAARAYWLGQQVAVIAPPPAPVATALKAQSVPCATHTPDDLLAPGLAAVGKALGL
ncbi:2-dehydro-3-deoxygalactonokinase [Roseovarius sp.]|uniref:2-dehydro-3-deoxygalactonokinase n=1 Tax=Roseovarius sp. TaxID=1486281 RepID=UPI00260F8BCC|nr:2-dehydro-3-deoxygalactonokinase [Roseovarius sp.]MDM8166201.1 2-dehydro-3-deoxygalactonokinase [Roseovarius sp.]